MKRCNFKSFGLAIVCFSLGSVVQIFVPDIFIVIIFACLLLVVGIYLIKG